MNPFMPTRWTALASVAAFLPVVAFGHSYGPPPGVTGAPGDSPQACTQCHTGTPLNGGPGKVEILLAGDAVYIPGVKQRITIRLTDPSQQRWGFEFSPRLNSDLANGKAGSLASIDTFTQVFCADASAAPCKAGGVEFISHTTAGTRNGTPGPVTFSFDWTPPATDSGDVTLYVAGNCANGDGSSRGDHIYTANLRLKVVTAQKPVISANGVVSAASFVSGTVSPGSWVAITGLNLSATARSWGSDDIQNGVLPQTLEGVKVTINGKPAAISYVSPTQVNVLAPDDTAAGPVSVQVINQAGSSDAFTVQLQAAAPALFMFSGGYAAATHVDGSYLAKPGLIPGLTTVPAKPGEVVVLYGTGFGPTNPPQPANKVTSVVAPVVAPVTVRIGGVAADVKFAGLIPLVAGLYQFNVAVPASAANGDTDVVAQVGGTLAPAVKLSIQN